LSGEGPDSGGVVNVEAMSSASVEVVAAVDVEGLAGDDAGQIGGEEHHRVGDLFRGRDVVERGARRDLLVDVVGCTPCCLASDLK
jgi:hypothetical protein